MKKLLLYILLLSVIFSAVLGINQGFAATPSDTSPLPSSDIAGKAAVLTEMGILKGTAAGDLRLDSTLTRAEAATLVVRISGYENVHSGTSGIFNDVPATHWAATNINTAHSLGYVNGVSYNQFGPDRAVSANEFCTMLMRAMVPNAEITLGNAFRYYAGYSGAGLMAAKALAERTYFHRRDMVEMLYGIATRNFVTSSLSPVLQNEIYTEYAFNITVQSSLSGHSWSYRIANPDMVRLTNETTAAVSPDTVGSPVNTVYSFTALKPGVTDIILTYKSPSGSVVETREYHLTVNGLDELAELTASDRVRLGESRVIRLNTNTQPGYVWSYRIMDTIDYQATPTPTMNVASTGTPTPTSPPPIIVTHTPTPILTAGGGYLANCVLMREVPSEDGKMVQEFVIKTYLNGTARLNFYYMAANSGITSMTNPFKSYTIVVN